MGFGFWSRFLAIASFCGAVLISLWLIEYAFSEPGSDRVYFVFAPLLPPLLAAVGVAATTMRGRTGELLAWASALLLTAFFAAPGLIGPLYAPSALLMLIAAVLNRRAAAKNAPRMS